MPSHAVATRARRITAPLCVQTLSQRPNSTHRKATQPPRPTPQKWAPSVLERLAPIPPRADYNRILATIYDYAVNELRLFLSHSRRTSGGRLSRLTIHKNAAPATKCKSPADS